MFCSRAKEYLSRKQVPFEDHDITKEPAALEELQRTGFMTTPVIVIDGEVIVGFDPDKLDRALGAG